jgi:hypothetical protein
MNPFVSQMETDMRRCSLKNLKILILFTCGSNCTKGKGFYSWAHLVVQEAMKELRRNQMYKK